MKSLLNSIPDEDINEFHKDITFVLSIVKIIDIQYGEGSTDFIHNYAHFKRLIFEWNRKYPNLPLDITEKGYQIKLRIIFSVLPEIISSSKNLKLNHVGPNTLELVYFFEDLNKKEKEEFKLCAYLALKKYDKSINIRHLGSYFGFDLDKILAEHQGIGWYRRRRLYY